MLTLIGRSWRSWKREKGLAFLAVLALAIGIGSATAIFTVVNSVLLKPLPYTRGDRWVVLLGGDTRDLTHFSGLTYAELLDYQERLHNYEIFGWFPAGVGGDYNLTSPGQPRHIEGTEVSPNLLQHTGAVPVAGRFFSESDGPNVAVISHRLFTNLGPAIVNRPVTLDGKSYTVVGAMPAWFRFPLATVFDQDSHNDIWVPLQRPADDAHFRHYGAYSAYGKLKPGVPLAEAIADAKRVASQIRPLHHPTDPNYTAALSGLQDSVVTKIRPILLLLFAAAGLLLLITCANVAGLLVSRSVGRARETAVRVALGASQKQLALQYLFESLWISLAAAFGGILASVFFVRALLSLAAEYIPRGSEVSIDWQVSLFAIGLALLTATLAALAPLWQALRIQPNEVLSDGVRASAGIRSRRLSQALVIGEIALAFTLIAIGALLVWEFRTLTHTAPGFNPRGLFSFKLVRAGAENSKEEQSAAYIQKLTEALEASPGISNAAVANQIPLSGCCFTTSLFADSNPSPASLREPVSLMGISSNYFKTMGIPLVSGRVLNPHDTNDKLLPILVDETTARLYWPNRSAVGELAHIGGQGKNGSPAQVVGIVGAVLNDKLGKPPHPEIFVSSGALLLQNMYVLVRSSLSETSLTPALRRAVAQVDPAQPIYDIQSMDAIVNDSLIFERIEWIVITFFALAALLLAGLGIYGLTSYSVRLRTAEMGTRMALGSTGNQLLQLIAWSGIRLSLYGILIGSVAVTGATMLVVHYFEVKHLSLIPYILSMASVLFLALIASLLPAWRASLLSPMVAIRNEDDSLWTSARRTLVEVRERITSEKTPNTVDSTLLTEFIEASRNADSFSEALNVSLGDLVSKLHAQSALLLEKVSSGEFHCIASSPNTPLTTVAIPENGFLLNRLKFYHSPLGFSAADLETSHRWASEQKPQHIAELDLLKSLGLRLATPLRTKNDLVGLLLFGPKDGETSYSPAERQLVAVCAEQLALTMENARLNERVLEQEKVRRDIALATEVQKRLLPEGSPQSAITSLGAYTLAARNVGGDYYDFLKIGDHTLGIALADVAGKGIAAALIMAVVQASLRIIASEDNVSLPQLAGKMNRFLHGSTGFNSYATFFYAHLDEANHQLHYVNAGHNPPYLIRAESSAPIEELATGGMVIGMFPAASYEEAVVDLKKGDVLIAFTDGVTEALNPAEEEFGEDRLKDLVRRVAHLPITEITAQVSQALREWISDAPQHDDLTFVVMKVNE